MKHVCPMITAVDFFNEISLLWGMVCEMMGGVPVCAIGEGFPPGFEYSWADGAKVKKPVACSGPQYIDYVMTWVEEIINSDATFPSTPGESPCHFKYDDRE